MKTWVTDRISNVKPVEFFSLIDKNRVHITPTFPNTTLQCDSLDKTTAFLIRAANNEQRGENFYFYLRDVTTNCLIGYVCVKNIIPHILKAELAYFIDEAYQGKGIVSRAVAEVITYCFDALNYNKLYICTHPENFGSQRVAVKNGFTKEGILKEEFKNANGELEDVVYFGLLRSEYNNQSI